MHEFVVQYGKAGFVGRFQYAGDEPLPRNTSVVVRSIRGLETGQLLGLLQNRFTTQIDAHSSGELIRTITDDDREFESRSQQKALNILDSLQSATVPATFLDCEVNLDQTLAVLHVLPHAECDLDPLLRELATQFTLDVRLMDVSRTPTPNDPPEPKMTCGKPGCGTDKGGCTNCGTGGGCSTGSCSSGNVKSAGELTAYFADLREKMERKPLNY